MPSQNAKGQQGRRFDEGGAVYRPDLATEIAPGAPGAGVQRRARGPRRRVRVGAKSETDQCVGGSAAPGTLAEVGDASRRTGRTHANLTLSHQRRDCARGGFGAAPSVREAGLEPEATSRPYHVGRPCRLGAIVGGERCATRRRRRSDTPARRSPPPDDRRRTIGAFASRRRTPSWICTRSRPRPTPPPSTVAMVGDDQDRPAASGDGSAASDADDRTIAEPAIATDERASVTGVGAWLGRYVVIEQVGSGGMGRARAMAPLRPPQRGVGVRRGGTPRRRLPGHGEIFAQDQDEAEALSEVDAWLADHGSPAPPN